MLQLKNIVKNYVTGDTTVKALRGVSLSFRKSEFVSILGQSGCGKTTLLNIIGGLDKYTSGDLVINGVSTKKYTDADWDAYRNHKIGFVFQSYNLIPHQSVLNNVELALTLSGVSKKERRERAIAALEKVGLKEQIYKKPNQMSGGQMQRVAIARALVNNPDILLADEPTGALDSETSVQVMEILKEISKEKLIIMVTHNPEIAENYSTRIIRLLDGEIISDSAPYEPQDEVTDVQPVKKSKKSKEKTSMSLFTAISLSFNNLLTKKARTFLTSFAGSIGIIGIALILAVSTGVNAYIEAVQEETLSSYPITIDAETVDTTAMLETIMESKNRSSSHKKNKVYASSALYDMLNAMNKKQTNNLKDFKKFIEGPKNKWKDSLSAVQYSYDLNMNIYTKNSDGKILKSDMMELMKGLYGGADKKGEEYTNTMSVSSFSNFANFSVWEEMLDGENSLHSELLDKQYDVIYGRWPEKYNEVVLIVDKNNEISDMVLYALGLEDSDQMRKIMTAYMKGKDLKVKQKSWSYKDICDMSFKLVLSADTFSFDSKTGTYKDLTSDDTGMDYLYEHGTDIKITGILRPNEDASSSMMNGAIGYTTALTDYCIKKGAKSDIVKRQLKDEDIDVISGLPFKTEENSKISDDKKAADIKNYFTGLSKAEKASVYTSIMSKPDDKYVAEQIANLTGGKTRQEIEQMMMQYADTSTVDEKTMKNYFKDMDDEKFNASVKEMMTAAITKQYAEGVQNSLASLTTDMLAASFDGEIPKYTKEQLVAFYDEYMPAVFSESTLEDNLKKLGYVDEKSPSRINLFASTFENKDNISNGIDKYNKSVKEENRISYTDYVALLMSSITTIVNAISYVLIAFVAISLVVSSIMIGIITYISVLERTKEIGILRAIGASKRDVSRVFNAETLLVGFAAGVIGIGVSLLLIILINVILHALTGIANLNAVLPVEGAIVLIVISMLLTIIAGLIPSGIAAKKDPVEALRTE